MCKKVEAADFSAASSAYFLRGRCWTTVVFGRLRASWTVMNCPFFASRPILNDSGFLLIKITSFGELKLWLEGPTGFWPVGLGHGKAISCIAEVLRVARYGRLSRFVEGHPDLEDLGVPRVLTSAGFRIGDPWPVDVVTARLGAPEWEEGSIVVVHGEWPLVESRTYSTTSHEGLRSPVNSLMALRRCLHGKVS